MRYYKVLIICALLFFQCFYFIDALSQCNAKMEYRAGKVKGSNELSIRSLEDGLKDVKIELYDLNSGKIIAETKIMADNQFKVAFKNIAPSLYVLYVWPFGCQKPIVLGGEKHGILIEN